MPDTDISAKEYVDRNISPELRLLLPADPQKKHADLKRGVIKIIEHVPKDHQNGFVFGYLYLRFYELITNPKLKSILRSSDAKSVFFEIISRHLIFIYDTDKKAGYDAQVQKYKSGTGYFQYLDYAAIQERVETKTSAHFAKADKGTKHTAQVDIYSILSPNSASKIKLILEAQYSGTDKFTALLKYIKEELPPGDALKLYTQLITTHSTTRILLDSKFQPSTVTNRIIPAVEARKSQQAGTARPVQVFSGFRTAVERENRLVSNNFRPANVMSSDPDILVDRYDPDKKSTSPNDVYLQKEREEAKIASVGKKKVSDLNALGIQDYLEKFVVIRSNGDAVFYSLFNNYDSYLRSLNKENLHSALYDIKRFYGLDMMGNPHRKSLIVFTPLNIMTTKFYSIVQAYSSVKAIIKKDTRKTYYSLFIQLQESNMEILISSLTAKSYKKTLKKIIDILNRQEHERRKGNFDLWLEGKIKIYKEISKAEFSIEEKIKKQEWLSLLYDRRNDPHRLPIPPEEVDDIRFLLEEANRELYIYPLPNDKTVVLGLLDNVMSWYKKNISPKLAGDSWSDEGGVYRLVDGFDRLSYVYMLFDRIQQSRDIIKQGSSGLDARFIDGVRERFYEEPLWKDLQGLNEEINFRYTNAYQRSADIAVTPLMFLNPGTILIVAGALVLTGGTGLSFVSFVVRAWQVFGFVAGSGFVAKEVVVKVSENHELIIGGITGLFTDVGESPYDYYSGISVLAELEADAIFVLKNTHDEYALVKVTKTEYNIANVTKEEAEAMIAKAKTLEPVPKEARATEGTRAIENNGTAGKNVPDNPILPEVVKPPKWKKPAKVKEDELTKTKRRIDKLLGKGKLTAKERKISDELLKKLYHDSFLSDQIIKKLVDKGCDKKGLETLRKKLIDKIADASQDVLDVEDLLKIIRKYDFRNIGRSPFCLNFINNFHEANGFENVLIQWMKGKAARKGASFVMKFSNNELKGKKIAFEWPAGYQDSSKFGPESPWRYSDIVVIENGRITKRYELKSWTEKSFEKWGEGLLKQYSKDVILFEKGNFNWVFYANKFFIWRDQSLTREARITLIKKYIIDNLISTISKVDASKIGSAGIKDVTEKELEDAVIIFVEE